MEEGELFNGITARVGITTQRVFSESHSQEKAHWEFPEMLSRA